MCEFVENWLWDELTIRRNDFAFQYHRNLNIHFLLDLLLLSHMTSAFSRLLHIPYRINCCFSDIWVFFFLLIIKAICVHYRKSKKSVIAERRKQNSSVIPSLGEHQSFIWTSVIPVWVAWRPRWCACLQLY